MAKDAKPREPKKDDIVNLVLASGRPIPALITKVNKNGTVDLESQLPDQPPIVITSSPRDDTGKKPDSWLFQPAGASEPESEASTPKP